MGKKVTVFGTECKISLKKYYNGNPAIELYTTDTNELFAMASVNLELKLPKGQIYIKDYAENEGMLRELVQQGIVSEPLRYEPSGFVTIPVCELKYIEGEE